uniref:Filamin binding LIM protein 1 n=1 Tax=Anser brachyrhynchus TaxID=132585 RepID=A0A8B9C0J6_9AVES
MLPGKAEKRMASSVFITLVPPRREAATKERPQPGVSPPVPEGTHRPRASPPQPLALPNGGEGRPRGPAREDDAGAEDPAATLCKRMRVWRRPPSAPCLAFPAESCPRSPPAPVPSSSPVLILSEVPQPLSAEALGPALQQLDLAAPATLQVRPTGSGDAEADPPSSPPADICAFCHKAVGPREPTVEAMRKQYHADCFTCRTCHQRLAGQRYYQRDGRPTCDACYQATLEKCAKCQGLISERIVRAMGKGFHPSCFACTACGQAIGAESFAVDERDEVYCVADFYRKYAPVCGACKLPIIPSEDQDTYKIECLGRSFHESCYRCESCGTPLSPEPTEDGCYPLGQHLLCKSCHVRRRNESSC